jgi:hypothetical protein
MKKKIPNIHVIEAYYKGATNTLGSRVKLYSHRFAGGITISYNYSYNNIEEMAIDYLKNKGFNILSSGEATKRSIIITDTFRPLK